MTDKGSPVTDFINRDKERKIIYDRLQRIKQKKRLFNFIITVAGIPGIGKTSLLRHAHQEAQSQQIASIFIDFEAKQAQDNPLYALQQIAQHFFATAADWQAACQTYQHNKADPSQSLDQVQVVRTFVDHLKPGLVQHPLLLSIDNSHYIAKLSQEILEDVLERLYHLNRVLIVLAGRTDIRWNSFDLRRRTTAITLSALPKPENAQLLPGYEKVLTDRVYDLTRGYPAASVLAYQWMTEAFPRVETDLSAQFEAHEEELIFTLFEQIFEKHILHNLSQPDQIKAQLRYISPLRRFDDNLLAGLLRYIDKETYKHIDTIKARSYIRQMATQTFLVKWDSAKQAYALDPPLRHLLSLEMKFRDPPDLLNIHEFVMNWYQQAIDTVIIKDPSAPQTVVYLLEHIYHFTHFRQLKGQISSLQIEIQQKITLRFEGYNMRERVHFHEEFAQDDELAALLGPIYNPLTEFIANQSEFETIS